MKAIMEVLNSLFVWEQEASKEVSNEEIASNDMYYYAWERRVSYEWFRNYFKA